MIHRALLFLTLLCACASPLPSASDHEPTYEKSGDGSVTWINNTHGNPRAIGAQEVLPGTLLIEGNLSTPDYLEPLSNIRRIEGDLIVQGFIDLPHLSFLDGLEHVEGAVRLSNLNRIESLAGLSRLRTIGRRLEIRGNLRLISLAGLDRLESVGSLAVHQNPRLTELDGLAGPPTIHGNLTIWKNYLMPDANAERFLSRQRALGYQGDAYVAGNGRHLPGAPPYVPEWSVPARDYAPVTANLHDVVIGSAADASRLRGVTDIRGDLFIDNTNLWTEDLAPLRSLRRVGGSVIIRGNPRLDSVDFLPSLEWIGAEQDRGSLLIFGNSMLEAVDGFDSLIGLTGDVKISSNPRVRHVTGFRHLRHAKRGLSFSYNDSLETVNGFNSLRFTAGLYFIGNGQLLRVDGFHAVERMSGSLYIASNDRLETLSMLSRLERIGHTLDIWNNGELARLDGLESLELIGDIGRLAYLAIRAPRLSDISALSNVRRVGGYVHLELPLVPQGELDAFEDRVRVTDDSAIGVYPWHGVPE